MIRGMVLASPFRALRPTPAVAPRVASVPYDVVSTEEARVGADGEPLSFLRVTRSELELEADADPYADEVYERARRNFQSLRQRAPLLTEAEPSLYLYRMTMGEHTQTGVAAAFSVDEYEHGSIKRHEKTRRAKEDDRTRHITRLRAQTGVVLLTYRATEDIDTIVERAVQDEPLYDFVAPDGVAHRVWRTSASTRDALTVAFSRVPALYIADGHHRAASAARARAELRGQDPTTVEPCDTFLAVAFPDAQMQVMAYHRVVRDLAGHSVDAFWAELEGRFRTLTPTPTPPGAGTFSVYAAGAWRSFELEPANGDGSPVEALDAERLSRQVLAPLLGIDDLRTDTRVDFVGGIRGVPELERRVDSGEASAAFALHPVSIAELLAVADAGQIMPPKSTWFEPKLRDGLLIREI